MLRPSNASEPWISCRSDDVRPRDPPQTGAVLTPLGIGGIWVGGISVLSVVALVLAIALAFSNPTMDDYLRFVERELGRALDKMDQTTPTREQQVIRQI